MAEKNFSLKDQLFNAESLGRLAGEYAAAIPDFDAERFCAEALAGIPERSLMACLGWFADCLEPYLSPEFSEMAAQLEAAMPLPLDPTLSDDDFGHFIHAVPGVLAARHALETHRERALDLLHAATQRFSMEFYIRPFLNRWPEETLARLHVWADDPNYHVRRLVSEGTRPKLPWAKGISIGSEQSLPLLTKLHADPTRFVTRSVSNHLNDISKTEPDVVVSTLKHWRKSGAQATKEQAWMERHALRTLVKTGDADALALLGFLASAPVDVALSVETPVSQIGEALTFSVTLFAEHNAPVVIDYRIQFTRPGGKTGEKVFMLKVAEVQAGKPLKVTKRHKLRGDATTFKLHPGPHRLFVQVNGVDQAEAPFDLVDPVA